MIKKIFVYASMLLLLSLSLPGYAATLSADCRDKNEQSKMTYECKANNFWRTPLWVPKVENPGPTWVTDECVKDSGGVFNSSKNILDSCKQDFGGTHLVYSN